MKKVNLKVLVASLFIVYSVAFIGSLFTDTGSWYEGIKPSINPPNWVFPVVWNLLFFMIALSLYFAWTSARNKKTKKKIAIVFGINLFLNLLWSLFFFRMKNPTLAFYELILLWISIFVMVFFTYKINKKTSYLLIPYLLWVSFAGLLNYLIAYK